MRNLNPLLPRSAIDGAGARDRPGTKLVCLALALAVIVLAARIVSVL